MGRKEENAIYDRLRKQGMDAELIEFHARLRSLGYTNQTDRAAVEREISAKLGPAVQGNGSGGVTGFARHQGLLLELGWLGFDDASNDLPALIEWLCGLGCNSVTYDIFSATAGMEHLDE